MSDDDKDEYTVQAVENIDAKDWFLESTIRNLVNQGIEISITLTVGGAYVTGLLTSGKRYFEELGATVAAASKAPDDTAAVLGEAWKGYTAIYEKPADAPDDWQPPPVGFVHLRNAYYVAPGQQAMPGNGPTLWRGKLSSIDGFSIGSIDPPK
jgi:hypothetical protein